MSDFPDVRLAAFLANFDPAIAARAEAILTRLRRQLTRAVELVCDNAPVIGFGPSDQASEVTFLVVLHPPVGHGVHFCAVRARRLDGIPKRPEDMRPGNGTDRRRSLPQVQAIFRDIPDQPDLVLARESRAYTIEDWDSLALASLVATIERCYSR